MSNIKIKSLSILLAVLVVLSTLVIPVSAEEGNVVATPDEAMLKTPLRGTSESQEDQKVYNLEGDISVVDNSVIGKIDEGTAYITHGSRLKLNLASLNWDDIDTLKIEYSDGTYDSVTKYSPLLSEYELSRVDGKVIISAVLPNGEGYSSDLSKWLSFSSVKYDIDGIKVSTVALGDTQIGGDEWVVKGNKDLFVSLESSDSVVKDLKIVLNGNSLSYTEVDSVSYKVGSSVLSDILRDNNALNISAKNGYGSSVNYTVSFRYDSSEISVSNIKLSEENYETDDYIYSKAGNTLSLNINAGISGLDKALLYRNGVVYKEFSDSSISTTINEEGIYTLEVKANSGNCLVKELFDGKAIRFDDESPVVKEYRYLGNKAESKWYNEKGIFEVVVEDNMPFNGEDYSLSVNGTNVVCDIRIDDNLVIYSVDLSNKTSVIEGENNIVFTASDRLGNNVGLSTVIKIDTVKPSSDGTYSNIYTEDNGVTYYKDRLVISGNFKDDTSGVSKVLYSDDNENFYEITLPYEVKETGYIRVLDNAENKTDYSVVEWLSSIGVNSFILDDESPALGFIVEEADYTKDGKIYYKDIPTSVLSIVESEFKRLDIYVNGDLVKTIDDKTIADGQGISYKPESLSNGEVIITIVAYDMVDHEVKKELTFVYDNTAPDIVSAKSDIAPTNYKGDYTIFNNKVVLSFTSSDELVGVKRFIIKDSSGNVVYTEDGLSSTSFKPESGKSYLVYVEDFLGNTSKPVSLKDLLGWQGNTVIIDDSKPAIEAHIPNNSYSRNNSWFGEDVTFSFDITDNVGVESVEVLINGEYVDSFLSSSIDDKATKVYANTSKVTGNNGRYDLQVLVKDVALNDNSWSATYYIDKTDPKIENFLISGDVKRIGKTIGGSNNTYGFFFDGDGQVEVTVSDGDVSSGIYSISTKLDGQDWVVHETSGGLSTIVQVPSDYKGYIYAKAEDIVGHESTTDMPDGLVSETSNTAINMSNIDITMPKPVGTDISGLPLYSSDTTASILISSEWSGIESVSWGLNDTTYGTITDMSSADNFDKNLALSLSTVAKAVGNANGIKLWVSARTNSGHIIENSKLFSIDKDVPIISVSYDSTKENGYYNVTRVASISITERNFDSSLVELGGSSGSLGSWSNSGDVWSNTITYASDGDYQLSINCTDKAGNKAQQYSGDKFTIDKTAPTLSVSWDNDNVKNGKYYSNSRTATVTVVEHNFDSSLINISGASFTGWSGNGDTHISTVTCNSDGEYAFSISGSDLATNKTDTTFNSGSFIVDMTKPTISIDGVEKGISYKKDLAFSVSLDDKYMDSEITSVKIYGKNHKELNIQGVVIGSNILFSYSDFPKDEDTDDVYTLVITAVDLAGNVSSDEFSFSVNRFGSKYSFYDAEVLGNYINEAKDIKISETNVDKIDTSKLKIVISRDGNDVVLTEKDITIDVEEVDGKYVYTYTISKDFFKEDGKYSIQIYSSSDDGTEYTSVTEEYSFILDTTAPEIVISGIENDGKYQGYERPVIVEVRDLSGVKEIEVLVNNSSVSTNYEDGLYSLSIKESPDKQSFYVKVVDNAGNESSVEVSNFTISSNYWVYLWNQVWFKILLGLIALIAALLVALMIWRIRKGRSEEAALAKENDEYYHGSSSGDRVASGEAVTDVMTEPESGVTEIQDISSDDSPTDIID